jgi:hypothetical protein
MRLRSLRFAILIASALVLATMSLSAVHAQDDDELARLLIEVMRLHGQGKFAEALPLAERSVQRARDMARRARRLRPRQVFSARSTKLRVATPRRSHSTGAPSPFTKVRSGATTPL